LLKQLGIKRITHKLPFRLNHVNCFIGEGHSGWTIIDAGLNRSQTSQLWNKTLSDKEVSQIIITHYHPDHFGYAGSLQKKTKAKVYMTEIDHEAANLAWQDSFIDSFYTYYKWSGIPISLTEQMIENNKTFMPLTSPKPQVDTYLVEGDIVKFGHYEYEIIFTPGHSTGLICLYNKEKNVLLSTDHILPKITPNISYWFVGDLNPLKTYLQSLEKVKKLHANYVIPSHGDPFYNANKRIDEIIAHHEERLDRIVADLQMEMSAYDVCQKLFPRELTVHEWRFAIGETLAHLEYLHQRGECQRKTVDDTWIYYR